MNFSYFFKKAFGRPSYSEQSENGFQHYEWLFKEIKIYHYVLDRFGPEERLGIAKEITKASSRRGLKLFSFLSRAIRPRC